jgi:hypothetical protein
MRWFNHYAYTYVAVYGRTYCEAASQTWDLFVRRGFDALVNDQLVGSVLSLGALIVALLNAAVAAALTHEVWRLDDWVVWTVAGALIGMAVAIVALEVIDSAVAAAFVCFAEDPHALAASKPDVYARINNAVNERFGVLRQLDAAN